MTNPNLRSAPRLGRPAAACVVLLAAALAPAAAGQSAETWARLRADVSGVQPLYLPNQPITVRFSLVNPTNDSIEIAVPATDESGGVGLPESVIIGTGDYGALRVARVDDPEAAALQPIPPLPTPEQTRPLRLAPRAVIGAELDLRAVSKLLRYAGNYRLEWQPLGDAIPPVRMEFRVEQHKQAIIVTDYGKISFDLFYDRAPLNVTNFLSLVREGFYDGKTLHRVVPGFAVQGGCPVGDGTGLRPDGKLVAGEFSDYPVDFGTLAMARRANDPNSASCQFFIALARLPELDAQYTVIGQARDDESLRTLRTLAELPTDRNYHPLRTLTIRSVSLVDVPPDQQARSIERKPGK